MSEILWRFRFSAKTCFENKKTGQNGHTLFSFKFQPLSHNILQTISNLHQTHCISAYSECSNSHPLLTFFTFETFVTNVQTLSIKTLCLLHLFREWQPNDVVNDSNTFFRGSCIFRGTKISFTRTFEDLYTLHTNSEHFNHAHHLSFCSNTKRRKKSRLVRVFQFWFPLVVFGF